MVNDLIILAAGGDGRNISEVVKEINNQSYKWNLLGYLDDDSKKQGLEINDYPVLGTLADAHEYSNCYYVGILGNVKNRFLRKKIIQKLDFSLNRFATLIHPEATVSPYAKIGKGTVVLAGARVNANSKIGNHVYIQTNTNIGHDSIVNDFCTIATTSVIAGYVKINEGCYVGMNSTIRERTNIGKWSIVGMGSVILNDVPSYCTVVGNPGKVIKKIYQTEY